ncbi:MAG: site-2 protease family protein [Sulfolobales archaeon]|nr:site-2 protease family protein [Sulfolobales archaeon]MCX8198642.1 site-2 protease family protein [Sulfolobales archaeon]MDW8169716.1 site-2 protease family protein [Desulfurococcaceae archaeon]
MSELIVFTIGLASFWLCVNIAYSLKKEWFNKRELKLVYGVALVYRRPYSPRQSKLASVISYASIPLALYSVYAFYVTMISSAAARVGLIMIPEELKPQLLVPGLNVRGMDLLFFVLAVALAASIHEFSHAIVARSRGIGVKKAGFALVAILPLAFIELDEESYNNANVKSKVLSLMAGPASNVALGLIALLTLPLLINSSGLLILDVKAGSIAESIGLRPYTIITEINGEPATIDSLSRAANVSEAKDVLIKVIWPNGAEEIIGFTKPAGSRIGIEVVQLAPNKSIAESIGVHAALALALIMYWLYIVNFSLGAINSVPLFITDGGQALRELLKKPLISYITSTATLIILILALLP